MNLNVIIINNWISPKNCADGAEPTTSNQPRNLSEDQGAKDSKEKKTAVNSKLSQLIHSIEYGRAIALLTAVILIMRFIIKKEYNRGILFALNYMMYIILSFFTVSLVAMPWALSLAILIAFVSNYRKMAWDNIMVRNSDATKAIADVTCLIIDGIEGPGEPEVWNAIYQLQSTGINVRMVTGENVNTARSIAIKRGIIKPDEDFLVLEGKALNERIRDSAGDVKQELFDKVWPRLRVLAASTPNDKYVLVKHIMESKLNPNGEVVAVTGRGADDIPALKQADIGFAMGIVGTTVAKEASDIILTKDKISGIVKAVMWGRNAYDSIAKFLQFQLCINFIVVIVEALCSCGFENSPFSAVHLLWIYVFVCSMASFALCTGIPDTAILVRKHYGRTKAILSGRILKNIIGQAVYQLVIIFILLFAGSKAVILLPKENYLYSKVESLSTAVPTEHYTIIFNTFSLMTLFNGLNARLIHGQRNIFEGLFTNRIFCGTFIITVIAQIVIVQLKGKFFNTVPLTYYQWMWCILFGVSVLLWGQVLTSIPLKRTTKRSFRVSPGQPKNANTRYTVKQASLNWPSLPTSAKISTWLTNNK